MSLVDRMYAGLPVEAQNLMVSLYGAYWERRRYGGVFKRELESFIDREKFSTEEWERYQTEKLRKILDHSILHVPFYREKWKVMGLSVDDFANLDLNEISRIPILSKDDLRVHGRTTLLADKQERFGQFYSSSGSSGTPTQIKISPRMHQEWTAGFEVRIRMWAGLNRNTPKGTIGGRRVVVDGSLEGPFYRYSYFGKQTYFSAYHISPETVDDYVDGMWKHKVEYMTGYAMANYLLAKFIEERGIEAPRLKAVITSSEKLTKQMRNTFRSVYGCESYDSYSGVEDCGLISECSKGKLHISPDMGLIEIVKEDGTIAKKGDVGEAICTGFINYDQPLIRYQIGDLVRLSENQTCGCGVSMPVVDEIIGRIEDTIIGPDGRAMVRFHSLFIDLPDVIESQVVQHKPNEFEIRIVTTKVIPDKTRSIIRSRMKSQLGNVEVVIRRVDSIPRLKNGKYKSVISRVS